MINTLRLSVATSVLIAAWLCTGTSPGASSRALANTQGQGIECRLPEPAERYAITVEDFGRRGVDYQTKADGTYWGGEGFLFGFERPDGEAFKGNPWGGYLVGGVVLAPSETVARVYAHDAMRGWTETWSPAGINMQMLPELGSTASVAVRQTPWEIDNALPMAEVFLSLQHCNAAAHFLLSVMPEFQPVIQAKRYADILFSRMQSEQVPI